jgi:hypothetical protein
MRVAFVAAMQRDYDYYLKAIEDVRLDGKRGSPSPESERELTERIAIPVLASGATRGPSLPVYWISPYARRGVPTVAVRIRVPVEDSQGREPPGVAVMARVRSTSRRAQHQGRGGSSISPVALVMANVALRPSLRGSSAQARGLGSGGGAWAAGAADGECRPQVR